MCSGTVWAITGACPTNKGDGVMATGIHLRCVQKQATPTANITSNQIKCKYSKATQCQPFASSPTCTCTLSRLEEWDQVNTLWLHTVSWHCTQSVKYSRVSTTPIMAETVANTTVYKVSSYVDKLGEMLIKKAKLSVRKHIIFTQVYARHQSITQNISQITQNIPLLHKACLHQHHELPTISPYSLFTEAPLVKHFKPFSNSFLGCPLHSRGVTFSSHQCFSYQVIGA